MKLPDAAEENMTFLLAEMDGQLDRLIAYFAAVYFADDKPKGLYSDRDDEKFWQGVRTNPTRSTRDVRSKFRDIDRRLADIEIYYTSRNTRLADEIDSLR